MKVAVITDDGKSISRHFGRAPFYLVAQIEDKKVTAKELREKLGHNQFSGEHTGEHHHAEGHGSDPESHSKHGRMAAAITDCEALICGGMGMGAYQSMKLLNIRPIITELEDIDEALQAYLDGSLIDRTEMLH